MKLRFMPADHTWYDEQGKRAVSNYIVNQYLTRLESRLRKAEREVARLRGELVQREAAHER